VDGLFKLLQEDFYEPEADWKGRYKDHSEKMRTGSIFQVAEVLKNLVYLSYRKSLSFREKRMLDRAKQLIISEVATVRGLNEKSVEDQIDRLLSEAYSRSVKTFRLALSPLLIYFVLLAFFMVLSVFFPQPRPPSWQ